MENENTVVNYYQISDEDSRMQNNPLEYIRCKEIISRYLTNEKMVILDAGGATGAFSLWLAEQGHDVNLLDIIPKHIEIARRHEKEKGLKLSSAIVGDARELPFEDCSFDLVLLMGPLYHLIDRSDRIKVIKEAYRVLKPGGKVICEYISRYASMFDGFRFGLINDPEFIPIMHQDIESGLHINTSKTKKYFTDSYFHLPEEVAPELEEGCFIFEDLIALTSFGNILDGVEENLNNPQYKELLLKTIRMLEKEPSLMGVSSHYIGVARKDLS